MHVLVPCKGIATGKTRLRDCLKPREHRSLCQHLVARTLEAAISLAGPERVRLVTSDSDARALAAGQGVRSLDETALGLNADLEAARDRLMADGSEPAGILVLPIDLPFADVDALAHMTARSGDLVIAPDERETGTNAMLLRPAAFRDFRFAFGPGSFPAHVAAARQLGLTVDIVEDWRLSFDIDEPAHYMRWLGRTAAGSARAEALAR